MMIAAVAKLSIKQLSKAFSDLNGTGVKIGIFEDNKELAKIYNYQEYGTANIPPRPTIRPLQARMEVDLIVKPKSIERLLNGLYVKRVGKFWAKALRSDVYNLKHPANAPSTIAKKGFDNPLVDTGSMAEAITYEIQK